MSKVSLLTKRVALISLTLVQVFFYPALSYADTASNSTPSESSSAPVVEAAPQSPSETAPVTEQTPPASSDPAPQAQALEVTQPEAQLGEPEEAVPAVSDATDSTSSQDQDTTINSSVQVTNTIPNTAQSGDAAVGGNRVGGSATTGGADGTVNLINLLQSQSNVLGQGNMLTFTADIQGDVVGDLFLDPGQLAVQSSTLSSANVRVTNAAGITNLVDLNAQSGDATVAENRVGGDATTGDANAMLNIVNILNSIVTSGGSFFGTINIHGNLNGDILLPPDFLSKAIASNSIPVTTMDVPTEYILDTNLTNNQAINNQINVTAASGDAQVKDNRVGGNATTGQATTKVTVLNLTGNQVVAANTMLVFVNVQGEWVGLLMDAPSGSTAAALGGGIVQNTVKTETDINVTNNQQINNIANVNATSGDATVRDNRVGGNATAGNATASVNIANMANTSFSLSNWFGILFINVFGTWHGSFGVDTAAGNPVIANPSVGGSGGNSPAPQAFAFIPGGTGSTQKTYFATTATSSAGSDNTVASGSTLSDATVSGNLEKVAENTALNPAKNPITTDESGYAWLPAALGVTIGITLLAGERFVTLRQQRRG